MEKTLAEKFNLYDSAVAKALTLVLEKAGARNRIVVEDYDEEDLAHQFVFQILQMAHDVSNTVILMDYSLIKYFFFKKRNEKKDDKFERFTFFSKTGSLFNFECFIEELGIDRVTLSIIYKIYYEGDYELDQTI